MQSCTAVVLPSVPPPSAPPPRALGGHVPPHAPPHATPLLALIASHVDLRTCGTRGRQHTIRVNRVSYGPGYGQSGGAQLPAGHCEHGALSDKQHRDGACGYGFVPVFPPAYNGGEHLLDCHY